MMARSIDLMFALPEFRSFLRQLDPYQAAPLYHLLRINGDPTIPDLDMNARKRLSSLIEDLSWDQLRIDLGKLYFLFLLNGSGFIAEKLISNCDEDFVLTFIAGASSTSNEERLVKSFDGTRNLFKEAYNYFNKIVKTLIEIRNDSIEDETTRREILVATNDFISMSITDPDRLFDLSLYQDFIEMQGASKSWVTQHMIDGYLEYKKINSFLVANDQGEKRSTPSFSPLSIYGLILGLRCTLNFELEDEIKNVTLSLEFFLDLLYGLDHLLTKEECFTIWLERNGIQTEQIKRLGSYPYGLHICYTNGQDPEIREKPNNLVAFLSERFGMFYDMAAVMMRLLTFSTHFDLSRFPELGSWKNSMKLLIGESNIEMLPIIDAINERMKFGDDELRFRSPIVPWDSRMNLFGSDNAWPKCFLERVENVSNEAREVIKEIFFDKVSLMIENYWGGYSGKKKYPENIYILSSRQEMLEKLHNLSLDAKKKIEDIDFYDYLVSMGASEGNLSPTDYVGEEGLKKAISNHSLVHIRFGSRDDFTWPMFDPRVLE